MTDMSSFGLQHQGSSVNSYYANEYYESYEQFLQRTNRSNNNETTKFNLDVGSSGLELIDAIEEEGSAVDMDEGYFTIDGFHYKMNQELVVDSSGEMVKENEVVHRKSAIVRNSLYSIDALEEEVEEINFDGTSKIHDEVYTTDQSDMSSLNEDSIASDEFMNIDSSDHGEDSPGEMSFLNTSIDLNISVTSSDVENYEQSRQDSGDNPRRRVSLNLSDLLDEVENDSSTQSPSVTLNEKSGAGVGSIGGSVDEILARYQKHINIVKKPTTPSAKDQSQKRTLPLPLKENCSKVIVHNNSPKQSSQTTKATLPLQLKQPSSILSKMNVGTTVVVKKSATPASKAKDSPNPKKELPPIPKPIGNDQYKKQSKKKGSFVCDICNKAYAANHLLLKHKTVHTGGKMHQCKKCSDSYDKFSELRTHSKTHA